MLRLYQQEVVVPLLLQNINRALQIPLVWTSRAYRYTNHHSLAAPPLPPSPLPFFSSSPGTHPPLPNSPPCSVAFVLREGPCRSLHRDEKRNDHESPFLRFDRIGVPEEQERLKQSFHIPMQSETQFCASRECMESPRLFGCFDPRILVRIQTQGSHRNRMMRTNKTSTPHPTSCSSQSCPTRCRRRWRSSRPSRCPFHRTSL